MVFTEYEQVPKRRPNCECSIAQMPDNSDRNRFQDVLPYDDTRVELVPTKENNTGYINASHIRVSCRSVSSQSRMDILFYILEIQPQTSAETLLFLYQFF